MGQRPEGSIYRLGKLVGESLSRLNLRRDKFWRENCPKRCSDGGVVINGKDKGIFVIS